MRNDRVLLRAAMTAALLVGLGSGLTAKASFFTYDTRISVSDVSINGAAHPVPVVQVDPTNQVEFTPGQIPISLTGLASPAGPNVRADGRGEGTTIVFGNISTQTTDSSLYESLSFGFTFTLDLTNFESQTPAGPATGVGSVEISGLITGSAGSAGGGRRVTLHNLQTYATHPADGLVEIGGKTYEVSLTLPNGQPGFTPPGSDYDGRFSANIRVVPEPGSVVLIGLGGLMGLVGIARRRRRNAAA